MFPTSEIAEERKIDIVESSSGAVAAIEVKAGASIVDGRLRNLRAFRDRAGESFVNGVVLYAGERTA